MKIITGKQERYQKVVVYGPEGIGKSTFAALTSLSPYSSIQRQVQPIWMWRD